MKTKTENTFYEVLPRIHGQCGDEHLCASYLANNGIRISIENDDVEGLCSFDFTDDQAEQIGQALVRWAQRNRAERELIRCNMDKGIRP